MNDLKAKLAECVDYQDYNKLYEIAQQQAALIEQQAEAISIMREALEHHHKFGLDIHDKSYIGTDTYKDTVKALAAVDKILGGENEGRTFV